VPSPEESGPASSDDDDGFSDRSAETVVEPVRQSYVGVNETESVAAGQLQRGYEVGEGQFAVVHSEELRRLRQPTSPAISILRSVRMDEIDPIFLETSYYVLPGDGGAHPYGLFYLALKESGYAALAEVAMHGRQHVVVVRPGAKGLIAHTMYYVNEVPEVEEYATETKDVAPKELELAKRFVEAIAAPFQPDEFTDRYREQLESLIASKERVPSRGREEASRAAVGNVIDIMDALRKSLEKVRVQKTTRKPVAPAVPLAKSRKRRV
jgi:DNA end-binding protein Ku